MCANRQSDHAYADMCIDRKNGLSRDISDTIIHSFVRRILTIDRNAKLSFVRFTLILFKRTRSIAKAMHDNHTVPGQASRNLTIGALCTFHSS